MTTPQAPTPLREALYAFSLAKPVPDAELLDEFTRRYPEHAAELTDFAVELAVDALRGSDEVTTEAVGDSVSPAVSRALSDFQNRLFELGAPTTPASEALPSSSALNPFATLDRAGFRALAQSLNANTVFVVKLRDGQIAPDTITPGFRAFLSEKMTVPIETINAHLAGRPQLSLQTYKSETKPTAGRQQSFEEAVRSSGLSEPQQQYLLKL